MTDGIEDEVLSDDVFLPPLWSEHYASFGALTDVLETFGWTELFSDLPSDELSNALDVLLTRFFDDQRETELDLFQSFYLPSPMRGTVLQFFFDLFGYGSEADASQILVSYLPDEYADYRQHYELYSGDSPADIQFFFESIRRQPALIFQGIFLPQYTNGVLSPTTRASRQRSLNAVCVDIDPLPDHDGVNHPIDPEVLQTFLVNCPPDLLPGYISLSGNGLHFWYIFETPVQMFSKRSLRVRKLNALVHGLYSCIEVLLEGTDSSLDFSCATLSHGFRAPGSLTKYNDLVLCFCPFSNYYRRSVVPAHVLSRTVSEFLGSQFRDDDVLLEEDTVWKSSAQLAADREKWLTQRLNTPATESQLLFLYDLEEQGCLRRDEAEMLSNIDTLHASELIRKALARRNDIKQPATTSDYSGWFVKKHSLVAGETGGVYQTVLDHITEVRVGRRYNSLHALAGIAYMMIRPGKPKEEVRRDFEKLLSTPWARQGNPLTPRDIENALKGYNPNNVQTVNSIITTLGFSPFRPSAKRNGRKQEDHLAWVAHSKHERNLEKVMRCVEDDPEMKPSAIALATGLSRPTVYKYLNEIKSIQKDE